MTFHGKVSRVSTMQKNQRGGDKSINYRKFLISKWCRMGSLGCSEPLILHCLNHPQQHIPELVSTQ